MNSFEFIKVNNGVKEPQQAQRAKEKTLAAEDQKSTFAELIFSSTDKPEENAFEAYRRKSAENFLA